jgi:hypothetical protein
MPDNMQRIEATESKRKQACANKSMGKKGKPRESTRALRSPPAIITRVKTQQKPAKARKGWERPGKARKSKKIPGKTNKAQQSPETKLKRPWSVQRAKTE